VAYIGLSLSFCVKDIAAGVIPIEEVIGIRSATAVTSTAGWDRLIAEYRQTYWAFDPEACEAIARRLIASEGIIQPRLEDKATAAIANGHWEKDGQLISNAELLHMYQDKELAL
jgi:hypothetical protein